MYQQAVAGRHRADQLDRHPSLVPVDVDADSVELTGVLDGDGDRNVAAGEASVLIEIFGEEELVAASGRGPVHALDNAMRKVLEKHYPQLSEVRLEEFDVRLLHHGETVEDDEEKGLGGPVRVLGIFSDGRERWGTVGVAEDILQASVECMIDDLEWKLRGEHKH